MRTLEVPKPYLTNKPNSYNNKKNYIHAVKLTFMGTHKCEMLTKSMLFARTDVCESADVACPEFRSLAIDFVCSACKA